MTEPRPEVLFITRKWAPAVGGMETWSVQITRALRHHADLEVIALPGRSDGRPPATAALLAFPLTVIKRIIARKPKADIVHLGDLAIWPLALLGGHKGKVVISAHGTDASYARRGTLRGRLYRAYLKLGAKVLRGATVSANSAATAQAVRATGWRNVEIIPLATAMQGVVREEKPERHLLFVGRIIPLKGLSWFANHVLPQLDPDLSLLVAGPATDPKEAEALDHPRIRHLGMLSEIELADEYRRALCVIVPNIVPPDGTFEGFGLVATEAAAAGGVVLASASGGIPEAVIEGETGFLLPPEQPKAWIEAVAKIANWSLPKRKSFVSASLGVVDRQFRWDVAANRTAELYRHTLSLPEI